VVDAFVGMIGFPILSQSAKAAAKGPVKKKKRAKKDKDAPKGSMSAFMFFSQKERPLVSKTRK